MASVRAAVVVTGTEVLTGRVTDRNGPWLAQALADIDVDIAAIVVVGDRPEDLRTALERLTAAGLALVITSGGLGPTADDLTADVVAAVQGRDLVVDPELHARVAAIIDRLSVGRGWRLNAEATAAGARKQARVPIGATVLEPTGTAPGLVVPPADGRTGPPVLVLPGPPSELQEMWPAAIADPLVAAALETRESLRQRTIRLWGTPESELAATMRDYGTDLDGLEITTCLSGGELEIVSRFPQRLQTNYDTFAAAVARDYADTAFSLDGRSVDDIVADALVHRGLLIATAESCTGGLLAGRLTERPGSSAYVHASVVTYSNAAKSQLAYVPADLITRVGAVSAEVAEAMARGACRRAGSDVGVGITGIAGPGGGSPDKPVGLVHVCAVLTDARSGAVAGADVGSGAGAGAGAGAGTGTGTGATVLARRLTLAGDRAAVRARTVTHAMHLVRQLLGA